MYHQLLKTVAIILMLVLLCGCALKEEDRLSLPSDNPKTSSLADDELNALLACYDGLDDTLTDRQVEIVDAYRTLRLYMRNTYPDVNWQVEAIDLGQLGTSPYPFWLRIGDALYEFTVGTDPTVDGSFAVIADRFAGG